VRRHSYSDIKSRAITNICVIITILLVWFGYVFEPKNKGGYLTVREIFSMKNSGGGRLGTNPWGRPKLVPWCELYDWYFEYNGS
jgi:hypothetical protein